MEDEIITIYCLLDDFIKSIRHIDWPNTKLSTAEVLLIQVIGMKFFYGNVEIARNFSLNINIFAMQ